MYLVQLFLRHFSQSVGGKRNAILIIGCRQVQLICNRRCEQAPACNYVNEQVQEES